MQGKVMLLPVQMCRDKCTMLRTKDQSILLFSHLFFFPAILLFFTYYAPYFAQEL